MIEAHGSIYPNLATLLKLDGRVPLPQGILMIMAILYLPDQHRDHNSKAGICSLWGICPSRGQHTNSLMAGHWRAQFFESTSHSVGNTLDST